MKAELDKYKSEHKGDAEAEAQAAEARTKTAEDQSEAMATDLRLWADWSNTVHTAQEGRTEELRVANKSIEGLTQEIVVLKLANSNANVTFGSGLFGQTSAIDQTCEISDEQSGVNSHASAGNMPQAALPRRVGTVSQPCDGFTVAALPNLAP